MRLLEEEEMVKRQIGGDLEEGREEHCEKIPLHVGCCFREK